MEKMSSKSPLQELFDKGLANPHSCKDADNADEALGLLDTLMNIKNEKDKGTASEKKGKCGNSSTEKVDDRIVWTESWKTIIQNVKPTNDENIIINNKSTLTRL